MKSFKECVFKLYLPTCILLDNKVEFKVKLMFQGNEKKDVVLNKAVLTNRFNDSKTSILDLRLSCKKPSHSIDFSIKDKREIYLTNANLSLLFLQSDGNKIIVTYSFDGNNLSSLENVEIKKMTATEMKKYSQILNSSIDNVSLVKLSDIIDTYIPSNVSPDTNLVTCLEPYLNDLEKEKLYLINEGGRKYKVTNGKYIGKIDNRYAYVFDLETELHIADDAPISLNVGKEKTSGTVMMCEDFQIVIVINIHMGQYISMAYINVEPWKLLDALRDRIDFGLHHNSKMMNKLLEGASLATNNPIEDILKGQKNAVKKSLKETVTIVWGPPGTGKTYTMADVALRFLENNKSVLIVSHSNVSVDGITKQIGKLLSDLNNQEIVKKGLILRYGYVRDNELRKDRYLNSFAYALNKDKKLAVKLETLQSEYEKTKAINENVTQKELELREQIKDIRSIIRRREEEYVKKARVVATTISKAIVDKKMQERLFDVVIFDEVSMASVLQIMSAASFAKEHMICVGDFMQLSPIAQSDALRMEEDIFSFLGINKHGKPYYHPWMVMLNEQRRMHPAISKFSNINIYKKLLQDHSSVRNSRNNVVKQDMFPGNPINIVDLSTTYCATTKNSDNSRYNILSGLLSFSIALNSEENVDSVGIITPYAAQTRLIRALSLDYDKNHNKSIKCSTVHQFQGSESDVIIFDAVESYPGKKPGWLMSKDINSIKRLINVAVTRARGKLIVVANRRFWSDNYSKNSSHTFYRLIDYIVKEGNTIQHVKDKTLEKMISCLSIKGGPLFYIDNSYIIDLLKDIKSAKEKIVISMPSGKLDPSVGKSIFDEIEKKRKKGVHILAKCNDYQSLSDYWKKITWETTNAVFPLVLIDDKITWYGAPFAEWEFTLDDLKLRSPCKIACRIKGEHTSEIIKSLSDLEFRENDAIKTSLTEKYGDYIENPKVVGLAKYASQLRKCPGCGQFMKMTKGKSGKTILWCKDCKKTELITPEEINKYIYKYDIKCPEHQCYIEAKVGKYGLYIKCDCNHYLKPEQI